MEGDAVLQSTYSQNLLSSLVLICMAVYSEKYLVFRTKHWSTSIGFF